MSSGWWIASGLLPDSKTFCHPGSIDNSSTMHYLQACKGMSGEAFKAMSGVAPPAGVASGKIDTSEAEVDNSQPGDTAMPARCSSLCNDSACPSCLHHWWHGRAKQYEQGVGPFVYTLGCDA